MVRPVIRVPYPEDAPSQRRAPLSPFAEQPRFITGNSAKDPRLMSKVPSLLFEMEDAEEATDVGDPLDSPAEPEAMKKLHALLQPRTDQEYMLALHVRIAADEAAKRGAAHLTVYELADVLRRLGYSVKLRTALGGGWGGACLRNLRHSFLAVTLSQDGSGEDSAAVVVDPRFQEQFEIAHSTSRYARVLSEVPAELVAAPERLAALVDLLCTEMAVAFSHTGTPVPPWRQAAAMLSKWQPRRSEEVDVSREGVAGGLDVAAAINAAAARGGGGAPGKQFTGNNTVAQRLAMLGVEAAPASPISEGMEDLETWSTGTDDALVPSPNDAVCLSISPHEGERCLRVAPGEPRQVSDRVPLHFQGLKAIAEAPGGVHQPFRRNSWA